MKILLATKSDIYLPLYVAWLNSDKTLQSRISFEVSSAVQLHPHQQDKLVHRTLDPSDRDEVFFAVGDIFRLSAAKNDKNNLKDPVVVGGLIDKKCFWLVGGNDDRNRKLWNNGDTSHLNILTHSDYMTSYAVAKKYLTENNKCDAGILPYLAPGHERRCYEAFQKHRCKYGKSSLLYMTNDIAEVASSKNNLRECHSFINDPEFLMTGMFTSNEAYTKYKSALDDFFGETIEAINQIYTVPDEVAWLVREYGNEISTIDYRIKSSSSHLLAIQERMLTHNIFSDRLKISNNQITNRASVENDVTDLEAYLRERICPRVMEPNTKNKRYKVIDGGFYAHVKPSITELKADDRIESHRLRNPDKWAIPKRCWYTILTFVALLWANDYYFFFPFNSYHGWKLYLLPTMVSLPFVIKDLQSFIRAREDISAWLIPVFLFWAVGSTYVATHVFGKEEWLGHYLFEACIVGLARLAIALDRFPGRRTPLFERLKVSVGVYISGFYKRPISFPFNGSTNGSGHS
jgi:hypothetical protein